MVLTEAEHKEATRCAIYLFTLYALVMTPMIIKYHKDNGYPYVDCPRENIWILKKEKRRGVRVSIQDDKLRNTLQAANSICHRNLQNVHDKHLFYMKSFKILCDAMKNKKAANIIRRHLNFDKSLEPKKNYLLPKNDPMNKILVKSIKLYTALITDLAPAMITYAGNSNGQLSANEDPFQMLKEMVAKVQKPTYLGGIHDSANVQTSFDGRNDGCHMRLTKIDNNCESYMKSWGKLCSEMNQPTAAHNILNNY